MIDSTALDLAARFWSRRSTFTNISFKVVMEPGSAQHTLRVVAPWATRSVNVAMDTSLSGEAFAASQRSDPVGAFDLPGMSGIITTPGWSGVDTNGKPYYWRRVVVAESDPVTIQLDGASIEEYTERTVAYDPAVKYILTENSAVGEWAANFALFNGGDPAELVRRTSGSQSTVNTDQNSEATQMPWASIITFLLSFVLSKKSGKSTSTAALTGLAAGGATYLLADPSNPNNLFGIGVDRNSTSPGTSPPVVTTPSGSTGAGSLGQVIGGAVTGAGNVISNMGPGTAALVGGAAGLTLAGKGNWLLWGGLALGAILLLKN